MQAVDRNQAGWRSVAIALDGEAAQAMIASIVFASRFHRKNLHRARRNAAGELAEAGAAKEARRKPMPLTYAEHEGKLKAPAVWRRLLPLARCFQQATTSMVRTNGAFVAGYEPRGQRQPQLDKRAVEALGKILLQNIQAGWWGKLHTHSPPATGTPTSPCSR